MESGKLISVIVPCYKTEKWLPGCLDSLLAQTHANLEILCVDDGSPDRCGEILDDYAKRDARIKVIRQENRGLSGARNAALDVAAGDYLAFLDSDDLAHPDWLITMLTALTEPPCDIAVCGFRLYYDDTDTYEHAPLKGIASPAVYPAREALCRLIAGKPYKEFVWNKVYRRALWEGIRFPVGRNFEDVAVMYRVFGRARGVVALPGMYIDYRQHGGSIIGSRRVKNELDGIGHYIERIRTLGAEDPSLLPLLLKSFVRQPLRHLALVGLWNRREAILAESERYRALAAFLKEHEAALLPPVSAPDKAIVRLFEKGSLSSVYTAGGIAFCLRLLEKLGLKKEEAITDGELTEAIDGK